MTKRIGIAVVVVLLAANLFVAARLYSEATGKVDKDNPYTQMELITRVMELIRKDYVDGENVTYKDLAYGALKGMLSSLDPHSQFMDPQGYQDMKEDTEGKFGGIGVVISMSKEGFLTIVAPMEDTPGARAGLLPGDRIIKINGMVTEKMTLPEAVRQLRGDPGTKVSIGIYRAKAKDPGDKIKDYTIERAEIKVDSVKDAKMLQDGIGYIRITQFNEPTADEFEKALQKLEAQGMDALIIDLRNNPGGLLEAARKVASKFVPAGDLIVSTEGRDPTQKLVYKSEHGKKRLTMPLVVLVNGGSASGSEIVAGALQDLKRAVLVGETTFGKGSVQTILQLPDGSAVRLTTAKYYTPSHKVIHEHGVVPDISVPVSEEDERKLALQRARTGLPPAPAEKATVYDDETGKEVQKIDDVQLDRAIDVLKGVKLFAKQVKINKPLAKQTVAAQD
ncbi:MAG TPA: S41 family peptidase [Verrucomicrobiae bacterium]|nr:S41 family peptidase [Verrucomicrobiae bacterium]